MTKESILLITQSSSCRLHITFLCYDWSSTLILILKVHLQNNLSKDQYTAIPNWVVCMVISEAIPLRISYDCKQPFVSYVALISSPFSKTKWCYRWEIMFLIHVMKIYSIFPSTTDLSCLILRVNKADTSITIICEVMSSDWPWKTVQ